MNRKATTILLALSLPLALGVSCSREIASAVKKREGRIGLSQPRTKNVESIAGEAPRLITFVDKEGVEQTITRSEKDKDGEDISVVDLEGVTVTALSKNVPERMGRVSLDFVVRVPETLISAKWQLQLTPVLHIGDSLALLDKLFLSGADFLKTQQKGYALYQAFLSSIIPDEDYLKRLFDEKGYKKAIHEMERAFHRSWQRDLIREKEFIDWSDRTNRRYLIFNDRVERNQQNLKEAGSLFARLPEYWMIRSNEREATPQKYHLFLDDYRIARKEIKREDSLRIEERFYNYKKIMENERRKSLLEDKYNAYVRLPYSAARLDTVLRRGDSFEYHYVQEIDAPRDVKKVTLTLDGRVLAKDESTYPLPQTDTITYYISSMLQFLDETERYKVQIVERRAEVRQTSFITFEKGASVVLEELGENEKELQKIFETIAKLTYSGELVMDSISMTATASPEGSETLNKILSLKRSEALKNYLIKKTDDKKGIDTLITASATGEDWVRLAAKVGAASDEDMPNKEDILAIIHSPYRADEREERIKRYKADYAYLLRYVYPDLRAVHFKFNLHRRDMEKDTIHTSVPDDYYQRGMEYLRQRRYKDALVILSDYNDFNTGVCLMSLGYDRRAYEILSLAEDTPNRNYLLAILAMRLQKEAEAVRYLLRAAEADESKIWRGKLDPEINRLINAYNLFPNE